jgi:hypothetical protein
MGLMAAFAIAGASLAAVPSHTVRDEHGDMPSGDYFPKPKRGKGQNNRRGKGKRSPPRSRPNRLTISKRVRRKHRRAA